MDATNKLAIAAHLHVLLRRHVGRVTDVEWMVSNRDYALSIIDVARAAGHPELSTWATRLQDALLPPTHPPAQPVAAMPAPVGVPVEAGRYVRGLR